jgi:hypothetical protein
MRKPYLGKTFGCELIIYKRHYQLGEHETVANMYVDLARVENKCKENLQQ